MSEISKQKLMKMTDEAGRFASVALSKLCNAEVSVEATKIDITKIQRGFQDIERETIVAGIFLPISGEVEGASLLVFPEKTAFALCDLLMKREIGTTHRLSELDISALKEVGNIICGSFLTIFSNTLKIKLVEHVPEFSFDMFGAVVDVIGNQFAQKMEDELLIEVKFVFKHAKITGHVALVFGIAEMKAILDALELAEVNS
jgi:chemotaxis protein CheC